MRCRVSSEILTVAQPGTEADGAKVLEAEATFVFADGEGRPTAVPREFLQRLRDFQGPARVEG